MAVKKRKAKKERFRLAYLFPRKQMQYYDYNLLVSVIILICFGLIMLYSTSAYVAQIKFDSATYYLKKQGLISLGSLVMAIFLSTFDYHLLARVSWVAYLGAAALLVMVPFIGTEANGATRWIYIGGISIQPAELAKVAVIIFLPHLILKMGKQIRKIQGAGVVLVAGGIMALFTYKLTDNLSTAIIIAGITAFMLFIAHPKTLPFIGIAAAGVAAVIGLVYYLVGNADSSDGFRIQRILVWLDPEANAADGGYQVMQGLYAIGSGGIFGKGLGNSAQKLGAVPEAQNDMIFSIVCEELGVFGAVLMTAMFLFLLYRLLFIAQNAPDLYGSLIVTGIFAHIALQVILNISVVINLIPTTGITLPFVSYGGTSIVFLMVEIAIALSVSRQITFHDG